MGKNRNFKNVYMITVEGKTSNGFIASLVDNLLRAVVQSIGVGYQQVHTTLKVLETSGDYNADNQVVKEAR